MESPGLSAVPMPLLFIGDDVNITFGIIFIWTIFKRQNWIWMKKELVQALGFRRRRRKQERTRGWRIQERGLVQRENLIGPGKWDTQSIHYWQLVSPLCLVMVFHLPTILVLLLPLFCCVVTEQTLFLLRNFINFYFSTVFSVLRPYCPDNVALFSCAFSYELLSSQASLPVTTIHSPFHVSSKHNSMIV